MSNKESVPRLMWSPKSKDYQLDKFRSYINSKYKLALENYWQLYKWSITCYPEFWESVLEFCNVKCSKKHEQIVDRSAKFEDIPEWFKGARMNFAENLLRFRDDRVAFHIAEETTNVIGRVTYAEIYEGVAEYAAAMKAFGLQKGDIVACYIPNILPALKIMLATISIGAIWSAVSIEFGVLGVSQRLKKISPKLLFSVDSNVMAGEKDDFLPKLKEIIKDLSSIQKVVIIPYREESLSRDISVIPRSCFLPEFLENAKNPDGSIPPLQFNQLPFNQPAFIFFTSGTTGHPKAIIQSAGGILMMMCKERIIHGNASRNNVYVLFTTVGWISWLYEIGIILYGGSGLMYNGNPFFPNSRRMFDIIDEIGGTHLFTYPWFLDRLENEGINPAKTHSLNTLHCMLAGASVLKLRNFNYVHDCIKPNMYFGNVMGCTDIGGCIFFVNESIPAYFGEVQAPDLGMAVECWDDAGNAVFDQKGELVLTVPTPSVPIGFWGEPDNEKLKRTYFNKFKGVWHQGDYFLINSKTGGSIFYGRSDCVLNPGGRRFCSVEIYDVVESFSEIQDSVCVSQHKSDGDERVILFLKLKPNYKFTESLINRIKQSIESQLTKRHSPAIILETKDIPYTVTGKKIEVAVKKAIAGDREINRNAIANPNSLDLFYEIPELQNY